MDRTSIRSSLILEKDQSRGAMDKCSMWCTWRQSAVLLAHLKANLAGGDIGEG